MNRALRPFLLALVCATAAWSLARTKSASPPTLAQHLRDTPVGGDIAEVVRQSDGVISRFDRAGGAFLAADADGGEAYFRRQARRSPRS